MMKRAIRVLGNQKILLYHFCSSVLFYGSVTWNKKFQYYYNAETFLQTLSIFSLNYKRISSQSFCKLIVAIDTIRTLMWKNTLYTFLCLKINGLEISILIKNIHLAISRYKKWTIFSRLTYAEYLKQVYIWFFNLILFCT